MSEMSNGYILGFAAAVCVVSSLALAGTHAALKPIQDVNIVRDYQKDVLSALGLPEDGHIPVGTEIDELFASRVGMLVVDAKTGQVADGKTKDDVDAAWAAVKGTKNPPALLGVFTRKSAKDPASVEKYAMEVRGRGLWGPISGYIAIEPDGKTVGGTVFFAPAETPGLGLEITSEPFKAQWKGKLITDASGKPKPIKVAKGKATEICPGDEAHCVDGISGATLTCRGVTEMVDAGVAMYDPFFQSVRAGKVQGGKP